MRGTTAPNGPRVFRIVVRDIVDKFLKTTASRAFQLPQEIPLAGDLIVSGHRERYL
jgi:hypothetical protein